MVKSTETPVKVSFQTPHTNQKMNPVSQTETSRWCCLWNIPTSFQRQPYHSVAVRVLFNNNLCVEHHGRSRASYQQLVLLCPVYSPLAAPPGSSISIESRNGKFSSRRFRFAATRQQLWCCSSARPVRYLLCQQKKEVLQRIIDSFAAAAAPKWRTISNSPTRQQKELQ
jgi:hypothetical protein